MFTLNQKVVYPGHGVAVINRIVMKNVAGDTVQFFELKFLNKDMTVLVPVEGSKAAGIRVLSSDQSVTGVFDLIGKSTGCIVSEVTASNWSKRHKDYQCKLRTGDIYEICKMYCELLNIAMMKGLSFGEKSLLKQIERFLGEEISAVTGMTYEAVVEHMRTVHAKSKEAHAQEAIINRKSKTAAVHHRI
jgi:CarD family transcriptional regulator